MVSARAAEFVSAAELMVAALRHRGPDDSGVEVVGPPHAPEAVLANTRLAILDLSANGHQPMRDSNTEPNVMPD